MTRRELLVSGLAAAGYAAAARPGAATAVSTPAAGLLEGGVEIPAEGGEMPAYRARPQGAAGPLSPVVVVHEIFGVHEYVRDVCRRLARQGYLAVAPDLFQRQGDVAKLASVEAILAEVVRRVPDAQVLADLDATLAWAAASEGAEAGRAAVMGFCWGGRIAWLYAAHHAQLAAGVAWYGRLSGAPSPETPSQPLDLAQALRVPVLGLYGAADEGIPLEIVQQLQAQLAAAGSASEIVIFPGAPHGFHADYRPSYRELPAAEGWRRALAWLQRHGVTSGEAPPPADARGPGR